MNEISHYLRWAWWNAYYLPWAIFCRMTRRRVVVAEPLIRQLMRTRWPFHKFEPCVHNNETGRMFQIYLKDAQSYTRSRHLLPVEVHLDMETHAIVGFNVFYEDLNPLPPTEGTGM